MKAKFIIQEKNTLKLLKKLIICISVFLMIGCNQAEQPQSSKIISGKPFDIRHLDFSVPIDTFLSEFKGKYYKEPLGKMTSPDDDEVIGYTYILVRLADEDYYFYKKNVKLDRIIIITDLNGTIYSYTGEIKAPTKWVKSAIEDFHEKNSQYLEDNLMNEKMEREYREKFDLHYYCYHLPDRYLSTSIQINDFDDRDTMVGWIRGENPIEPKNESLKAQTGAYMRKN